jgi:hypothetical protein
MKKEEGIKKIKCKPCSSDQDLVAWLALPGVGVLQGKDSLLLSVDPAP